MQILCIGDVVGSHGCDFLRRTLPAFKRTKGIDVVIANGENSSDGNGITPASANHLLDSGVDIITTGNHTYAAANFTIISMKATASSAPQTSRRKPRVKA